MSATVLPLRRRPCPDQLVFPGMPEPRETPRSVRLAAKLAASPEVQACTGACRTPVAPVAPSPVVQAVPAPLRRAPDRGVLQGPAPTSRQVKTITLQVEQLDGGKWRLTMPRIPAWAHVASAPPHVLVAIRSAFTEAQVAAYSSWRGHQYDADVLPPVRRRPPRKAANKTRKDIHPPDAWLMTGDVGDDGAPIWCSPKGLRLSENSQVVQRVKKKRVKWGLSPRPDPAYQQEAS